MMQGICHTPFRGGSGWRGRKAPVGGVVGYAPVFGFPPGACFASGGAAGVVAMSDVCEDDRLEGVGAVFLVVGFFFDRLTGVGWKDMVFY